MGNAMRKPRPNGTIDGGALLIQSVDVQNANLEYNPRVIQKQIAAKKLAPIYTGRDEPLVGPDRPPPLSREPSVRRRRLFASKSMKSKDREKEKELAITSRWLLKKAQVECPICILYYPENINRTNCCNQAICTQCFVSLKRAPSGRTFTCPFCNQQDFGIIYKSPESIVMEMLNPNVALKRVPVMVRCEEVHIKRPPPIIPSPAYRYATMTRRHPYTQQPVVMRGNGNTGNDVLLFYTNELGQAVYYPRRTNTRSANYRSHTDYYLPPTSTNGGGSDYNRLAYTYQRQQETRPTTYSYRHNYGYNGIFY